MKADYDTLTNVRNLLADEEKHVRFVAWNEREVELLNQHLLLTAKPMVYLINLSEADYIRKKNKWSATVPVDTGTLTH